jgi:hypothetical protein
MIGSPRSHVIAVIARDRTKPPKLKGSAQVLNFSLSVPFGTPMTAMTRDHGDAGDPSSLSC